MKTFITRSINIKKVLLTTAALSLFLLLWFIIAIKVNKEYLIPYPTSVLKSLSSIISNNNFFTIIYITLSNSLICFIISFIVSITLSTINYLLPSLEALFNPLINILKAIPTISILLVSLIYLPANKCPLLVGSIILFPIMYSSFLTSLKEIDINLIELSKLYKVSIVDKILKLYIPSIIEPLFSQSKNCISLSVKLTIAAEVLAHTTNSIGIQMQMAKTFMEMDAIFAWTIIAIVLSLLLEGLLSLILKFIKRRKQNEYRIKKHF